MRDTVKGYLAVLISAVTYGMIPLSMIPIKQEGFSVDAALFYRFIITTVFIMGYLFYKREPLRVVPREVAIFAVLGLLYALSAGFLFLAYDPLSPAIASTIPFMYPLIVALALAFFCKEKLTLPTIIAFLIVLVGIFLLSVKDVNNLTINYMGAFISPLGALSYALYVIVANKSKISAPGIKVSLYSTLFSALYLLIKIPITGNILSIPEIKTGTLLVGFGIVTTLLSLITLTYAIQMIGSTPTAIVGVVEPIVAAAISIWVFRQEELTVNLLVGVVFIIIAVLTEVLKKR